MSLIAGIGAGFLGLGMARTAESGASSCPRLSQAAALPQRPGARRLRGDVDGDRRADLVTIRYAPRADASCGFLLVVEARSSTFALRIPEGSGMIGHWWQREPFVAAIVRLGERRSQVVVARDHGASTTAVSLYGIQSGRLERLRFRPAAYEDELSLFGSLGVGVTNVACRRGGPLIEVGKGPLSTTRTRSSATRTEYDLRRGVFIRGSDRTVKGSRRKTDAVARSWGLEELPFTGCAIARGQRL
jgi:hypothetical protein